jgi:hypothetical protein
VSESGAEALEALARMVAQYLTVGDDLDTLCMAAGERALRVLAAEGLVDYQGGRYGCWTEAGRELLARR